MQNYLHIYFYRLYGDYRRPSPQTFVGQMLLGVDYLGQGGPHERTTAFQASGK